MTPQEDAVVGRLRELGIAFTRHEHPPVATVAAAEEHWAEIDAAFQGHTDPLLGADAGEQYDALFSRIVNLAPPPIGVGREK